ncbi:hypothetical protein CANARDRAFT_26007 [[Candida] arabinofermentans NRRL YB-2248]|uniref:Vacuolar protein sorting-associated protein 51 homolog n=1 Tax=[Candida] arabinofermentans NRRL YB-2248 TaxID=983967 RepID=A0A1E4T7T7_9ASCO|nr:hypothetical protein CANARDRAFT_26007 [[Candida] arabinofermentans NRRL YB-2248]
MTEAISFKKDPNSSLKNRLGSPGSTGSSSQPPPATSTPVASTKTRRKALQDFYKLQESQKKQLDQVTMENSNDVGDGGIDKTTNLPKQNIVETELTLDNFDSYISNTNFIKILETATKITENLNYNQSEIKSIIYNNYYELIKINDVLQNLNERNEQDIVKGKGGITENLNSIKENLQSLKEMDLDIFAEDKKDQSVGDEATIESNDSIDPQKMEELSKSINGLILSKKLSKSRLEMIDSLLPQLKGESIILQMNEIKNSHDH